MLQSRYMLAEAPVAKEVIIILKKRPSLHQNNERVTLEQNPNQLSFQFVEESIRVILRGQPPLQISSAIYTLLSLETLKIPEWSAHWLFHNGFREPPRTGSRWIKAVWGHCVKLWKTIISFSGDPYMLKISELWDIGQEQLQIVNVKDPRKGSFAVNKAGEA